MGIDELTFVMTAFEQAHRIFKWCILSCFENTAQSLRMQALADLLAFSFAPSRPPAWPSAPAPPAPFGSWPPSLAPPPVFGSPQDSGRDFRSCDDSSWPRARA